MGRSPADNRRRTAAIRKRGANQRHKNLMKGGGGDSLAPWEKDAERFGIDAALILRDDLPIAWHNEARALLEDLWARDATEQEMLAQALRFRRRGQDFKPLPR